MSAATTGAAGGALVGAPAPGRPALTPAEIARRAARPVRDPDPARNAAYWSRIDACVDAAPELSADQRRIIAAAFSTVTSLREAA
ncbi:hypothetical protein [Streptomyces montanisoli]|uniref:Uncharacterized protein n=1 Tax=Streptomyces montanisoli TaxID=2798581 RepID=A0A940RTV4_9ACTN|nr:hypothetical protein [Streptomyces montanisoli]MBP0456490.1 hypothetical protein [Streptomyces montanisoli]